jgi:hypothetical protein
MQKTFRIGEYAIGGIIKVIVDDNARIKIENRDWDDKSLVQSKIFDFVDKFKVQMYLEEVTSSYYADKVMNWIYV